MQDYQHYFFDLVGGGVGQNANNWKEALEALPRLTPPIGTNPKPGEIQPIDAPHHGITVMIDAGGNARGRIWLPTDQATFDANGNAWFTHEIQVIADGPLPGTMVWAWDSKGGAAPRPFDAGSTPPPEPEPEPDDDHEERIKALEEQVKVLTAQMLAFIPRMEAVEQATTPEAIRGAMKGQSVDVRVGRNFGHGHAATGTVL
jgi:hypothetical protein